jgi:tetratricopeptide (TPR) repeat protein
MEGQIVELLKIGLNAEEQLRPDRPEPIGDRYERAEGFYLAAKDIASRDPALDRLRLRATASLEQIRLKRKLRRDVESLHASADRLRFGLLGYGGDLHTVSRILSERLQPFHVLERADWHELSILSLLGSDERKEFLAEVEDLLFLWAWSLGHAVIRGEQPGLRRDALILIDNGLQITEMPDVWLELRRRLEGLPSVPGREPSRAQVVDARLAFRWALVHWHDSGGPGTASRLWLARSVTLNPTRYWSRYLLGHLYSQDPDNPAAFEHFSVAAALRGDSPWAHLAMANEYRRRFVWNRALQSSRRALSAASEWSIPLEEARLNLGLILQNLGDIRGANQSYSAVIRNAGRDSRLGIDARVNLASLRAERGDRAAALRDYDALLADHPGNRQARFGRATLREITGDPSGALEDVNALMEEREPSSELLALRAQALLRLGRWMEAELDARRAYELDPRPSRRRMLDRIAVASRRGGGPDLDDPYEVLLWPNGGPSLERDIRATADRLLEGAKGAGTEDRSLIPEAALLLASIGDRRGRELIEAFVVRAPDDAPGRVARAKIRWVGGDLAGARADLSRVLALEPEHPAALAWLGRLQVEEGQWREGLASIERAGFDNPPPWAKQARGKALMRLGRTREALEAWNSAISDDDEDPYSFLGRADAFLRLGQVDQALADFELALQHAWDRPDALVATTIQYAGILRVRPDRAQRVLEVAGRCVGLVLPRVAEGRVSRPGANANRMGQSPAGRSPAPSR